MLRFNLTRWAAGLFIIVVLSSCATGGGQVTPLPSASPTPDALPAQETPPGYPSPQAQPSEPYPPSAAYPDLQATAPQAYPPAEASDEGNSWAPRPEDASLERGNAFVDRKQIILQETFPPRFILSLQGTLPTPCHQLRVEIPAPDAEQRIDVAVYSVVDPGMICAQVIEGFEARAPLENLSSGKYTVLVNGEVVDEIEMP